MKPIELITGTHPLLADRVRLAIMATLVAATKPVDFNTLLEHLDLTKGNLSSHLRKLEDGGLIKVTKSFVDRKPKTTYRCTARGRHAIKQYVERVESILKEAVDEDNG